MTVGPGHFAVLSALVFGIGLFGILARSDAMSALMSLALLFAAPVIALVGFTHLGQGSATPAVGDALAFLALVTIAAEGAVGAGAALLLWRRTGAADVDETPDVEI